MLRDVLPSPPGLTLSDAEVAALESPGFFVRDAVLGDPIARAVHTESHAFAASGALHAAGVSRAAQRDSEIRGDSISWLDRTNAGPAQGLLLDAFERLRQEMNQTVFLGLRKFEVQLARYPGGGARYVRHRDAFSGQYGGRRLTAIYYANPEWTPELGGRLRVFPEDGEPAEIDPVLDRMVVFLSDRLEHEVLPTHAPRLAITAWFRDQP